MFNFILILKKKKKQLANPYIIQICNLKVFQGLNRDNARGLAR